MAKTIYRPEYLALILRLREMREARGLAQSELARLLDWPQQRVSEVERGLRRMDVLEYLAVASHLGMSPGAAIALAQQCLSPASDPR